MVAYITISTPLNQFADYIYINGLTGRNRTCVRLSRLGCSGTRYGNMLIYANEYKMYHSRVSVSRADRTLNTSIAGIISFHVL